MQPSIFNYVVNDQVRQKVTNIQPKAYQFTYMHNNDTYQKDINIENDLKGLTQILSRCGVKSKK